MRYHGRNRHCVTPVTKATVTRMMATQWGWGWCLGNSDCVLGWGFSLARATEVSYSRTCWGQTAKAIGVRRKDDSFKICVSTQARWLRLCEPRVLVAEWMNQGHLEGRMASSW